MNVFVNGERRSVRAAQTVAELVRELKLIPATLLIEHNGTALHRHEWDRCALLESDRLELVRVVAGG